jgi:HD-like signal output (HDOD) protein
MVLGWLKRRRQPHDDLLEAVGGRDLPSFPAIVLDALSMLRDPRQPLSSVGTRLATDPACATRLLRIANSPICGTRVPVRSVEQAVSLLGRAQVEALLLSVGTAGVLSARSSLDAGPFWREAALRAIAARHIAALAHPITKNECFTAALLLDLAVPLIAAVMGPRYATMLADAGAGGELHALERAEYGWDHGWVGGALCREWRFPDVLTDAIGSHHDGGSAADSDLPAVALVSSVSVFGDRDPREVVVERANAELSLSTDAVVAALEAAEQEADALASCWS